MGCRLCQNYEFYELALKYWYLWTVLVFISFHTEICAYLRFMLAFTLGVTGAHLHSVPAFVLQCRRKFQDKIFVVIQKVFTHEIIRLMVCAGGAREAPITQNLRVNGARILHTSIFLK